MTDNDIIKALECHADELNACDKCPYRKRKCSLRLCEDALDLINRQKAELERLQRHNTEYARKHYQDGFVDGIKKFSNKLKEDLSFWSFDFTYYSDQLAACRRIDYLAKETEAKT